MLTALGSSAGVEEDRMKMFWDRVACVYDIFANVINRKTHRKLCVVVAKEIRPTDEVLECACGTGLLSGVIAKKCKRLVATDFSGNMLKSASRKCRNLSNVKFEKGDILHLKYPNESFDVVVAANVIHLLDEPYKALAELDRVCRKKGRVIIPTYMNEKSNGRTNGISGAIGKAGADFKREFSFETYKRFFQDAGYSKVKYTLCEGRIPCAVAVIEKM